MSGVAFQCLSVTIIHLVEGGKDSDVTLVGLFLPSLIYLINPLSVLLFRMIAFAHRINIVIHEAAVASHERETAPVHKVQY